MRLLRGRSNIFMKFRKNLYGGYQRSAVFSQWPGQMRAIDNRGLLMTGDVSLLSRPGQSGILFVMWPRHSNQE